MTDRDKKTAPDNNGSDSGENSDEVIPGRHGKHGGGMESEGAPQEQSHEAREPHRPNGADHLKH
jgi:hypothetical protein